MNPNVGLVLGIVSLFLTSYMLIYYAYLFRNTDHDVSFFLSVGIIFMIMNLFTNMGQGSRVLSVLYLVVSAAFIAAGWLVDADASKAFYTSIGPWFKAEFKDEHIGLKALSFAIAPAGIVLYFVNYKNKREVAEKCGVCGAWGLLIWVLLLWMILGIL